MVIDLEAVTVRSAAALSVIGATAEVLAFRLPPMLMLPPDAVIAIPSTPALVIAPVPEDDNALITTLPFAFKTPEPEYAPVALIVMFPPLVVVSDAFEVTAAPKISMLPSTEIVPADNVTSEVFPFLAIRKLAAPAVTLNEVALKALAKDALLGSSTTAPDVLITVVPAEVIRSPTTVTAPVAVPAAKAPRFVVLPEIEVTTPRVPPSSRTEPVEAMISAPSMYTAPGLVAKVVEFVPVRTTSPPPVAEMVDPRPTQIPR